MVQFFLPHSVDKVLNSLIHELQTFKNVQLYWTTLYMYLYVNVKNNIAAAGTNGTGCIDL